MAKMSTLVRIGPGARISFIWQTCLDQLGTLDEKNIELSHFFDTYSIAFHIDNSIAEVLEAKPLSVPSMQLYTFLYILTSGNQIFSFSIL